MRIEEKALILPSLYIIKQQGTATTSDLIRKLTRIFNPIGEDAEILAGRNDTKFSQKVRNLVSHRSSNGMADFTIFNNSTHMLSDKGEAYLNDNPDVIAYILNNNSSYEDIQKISISADLARSKKNSVLVYDENIIISEGTTTTTITKTRKRSAKLREASIMQYSNINGDISCYACGFNFKKIYGELGKDYIEIHHEEPLYQYSDDDFDKYLSEAIKKTKPLCSNCHRMLHRHRDKVITADDLKCIIKENLPV